MEGQGRLTPVLIALSSRILCRSSKMVKIFSMNNLSRIFLLISTHLRVLK